MNSARQLANLEQGPSLSLTLRDAIESAGAHYVFPEHLREQVQTAPNTPGVYIFEPASGNLPLYIGKSVTLRTRLQSHLRNPDEAAMLRQAQSVRWIETAGDLGAQLLEAQLIKHHQPLYNQKLRRTRRLYSLTLGSDTEHPQPRVVDSININFASTPGLYGLYSSPSAAKQAVHALADEQGLCLARLGLERLSKGRACFRHMVKKCLGVCAGRESEHEHDARLLDALDVHRITCWPYAGAVGLLERGEGREQIHVVNAWFYMGSVDSLNQARALSRQTPAPSFDADGYKLLVRPLMLGTVPVLAL